MSQWDLSCRSISVIWCLIKAIISISKAIARHFLPALSAYKKDSKSLIISHTFSIIDFYIEVKSMRVQVYSFYALLMVTFKIQVENFPCINWKTIKSSASARYCRTGAMERYCLTSTSYHLITLLIHEVSWHHLSINTYSLGIGTGLRCCISFNYIV